MGDQQRYEVIREGFARARFGAAIGERPFPEQTTQIKFAAGEDNGGLNTEEFLARPWRILSSTVTPYRLFDFTRDGVLKRAVDMFDQLTLYANHNADVNNWKGYVTKPVWDDKNDPPGINALLVIDRIADPKLARGVEIKALRSASVTIWFNYERSHPDLKNFYDYLGEEIDGELVRFIVTEIVQAGEVSIVWEGEDPFAKALSAAGGPGGATGTGQEKPHQEGETSMKVNKELAAQLGLAEGTDLTPESLHAKVKELLAGKQAELDTLKSDAEIGKQHLTETRQRAVTLYKALKGEKAVEAYITGVIEVADLKTAQGLVEEYQVSVEDSVPLTCPKCGEKLQRRSSQENTASQSADGKRAEDYKF